MSKPNPKTVAKNAGLPPPPKPVAPRYRAPDGRVISAPRSGDDGYAPPKPGWTVVSPATAKAKH